MAGPVALMPTLIYRNKDCGAVFQAFPDGHHKMASGRHIIVVEILQGFEHLPEGTFC